MLVAGKGTILFTGAIGGGARRNALPNQLLPGEVRLAVVMPDHYA
jgi:hypothetical protein